MLLIALYGGLIMAVSLLMITRPERAAEWGIRYCRKPYMHPVEIVLCIGFGLPFILSAAESRFPIAFRAFGWALVAIGLGLMLTPPSYHQRYGVWSIRKFGPWFRPLGVVSLAFGAFLLYAAL